MIYKIFNQKGFTLVEMLMYMGIFIIFLTVLLQLFGTVLSTQLESQTTSSVSEDAKYLLARMTYDISQAQNITSPALGVSSSTLQFTVNNSTYTYASSSGNLMLTTPSGSSQLNSSDTILSALSFTPVGSSSGKFTVEINFTLQSVAKRQGVPEIETIQTTVGNR